MEILLKGGFGIVLAVLGIEDIWHRRISSNIIFISFILGTGLCLYEGHSIYQILCSLLLGISAVIISRITKEGLGMGDSLIISIIFIALGGLKGTAAVACALFTAGLFSAVMVACKKFTLKSSMPFIPFLFAGYISVALL